MKDILHKQIKEELEKVQFLSKFRFYVTKVTVLSLILGVVLCGTYSAGTYGIKLGSFINSNFGMFWSVNYYLATIAFIASLILGILIDDE